MRLMKFVCDLCGSSHEEHVGTTAFCGKVELRGHGAEKTYDVCRRCIGNVLRVLEGLKSHGKEEAPDVSAES